MSLFDLVRASDPLGQVPGPVVHDDAVPLKQVGAGIGLLHPVPDHMRQDRLDHLPGMVRLFGRPVPEPRPEAVRHGRDVHLPEEFRHRRVRKRLAPNARKHQRKATTYCPRLLQNLKGATAHRARGVQVEGRLPETELRPRPSVPRSGGSLSGPTIPVSPQAAGPAVPERQVGAGGVSGCSGMPGSEKVQPARQSSRIQGGYNTYLTPPA